MAEHEKVIHETIRLRSWRQALPRVLLALAFGGVVCRRSLHLSWAGTATFLAVVLVISAVLWRLFLYKVPLLTSRRGRRMMKSGRVNVTVTCPSCGWRGNFLEMTSRQSTGEVDYFCPSCGREIGHTV